MDPINERFRQIYKDSGLSQEAFAKAVRRGRGEIANIIYGKTDPKDNVIDAVCAVFGVSEVWLRTGAGEMYTPKTREEELAAIFASVLISDDAKSRLIRAMARMPDEAFPAFVQFWEDLVKQLREE